MQGPSKGKRMVSHSLLRTPKSCEQDTYNVKVIGKMNLLVNGLHSETVKKLYASITSSEVLVSAAACLLCQMVSFWSHASVLALVALRNSTNISDRSLLLIAGLH